RIALQMSIHPTTAVTAMPAVIGRPIARTPVTIIKTLIAIDQVVPRRTSDVNAFVMSGSFRESSTCCLRFLSKTARWRRFASRPRMSCRRRHHEPRCPDALHEGTHVRNDVGNENVSENRSPQRPPEIRRSNDGLNDPGPRCRFRHLVDS